MPVVFGQQKAVEPVAEKPEPPKEEKEKKPKKAAAHDSGWQSNGDKPGTQVPATVGKQGAMQTKVVHPDGAEEFETEHMGFIVAQAPLCAVSVGAGATMNMGNYQSLKVSIMCSIPCEKKNIDPTYEQAAGFVEEKLQALMAKLAPGQTSAG